MNASWIKEIVSIKLIRVHFYWINECDSNDTLSKTLPVSLYNLDCLSCEGGTFYNYNLNKYRGECLSCAENTYSLGGSLRVDGNLKEWKESNEYYKKFQNNCSIEINDKEIPDQNCTGWLLSSDGSHAYSGSAIVNNTSYSYNAELQLNVQIVRNGRVSND